MAIIGYARVSTTHQKLDAQIGELEKYGVDKIYTECGSGLNQQRPILDKMLTELKAGDTLVIFKLDRLARGTQHLLKLLENFEERQIHFVSIQNHIDTTTPMGKLIFTIMGAFAEMEAALIRERVLSGLQAARENGVQLGRPTETKKIEKALELYATTNHSVEDISVRCEISISTIYRHLNKQEVPLRK